MVILILISLIIDSFTLTQQPSLHLHSHKWCPPCKKVEHLFNKLSQNYPQIKFDIHTYTNKTILRRSHASSSPANLLPFPTLIFNCSGKTTNYQNDLTIPELAYWIEVLCLQKIPTCTNNINQQLFHIAVLPQQNETQTRQQIQNYPHIKICLADNANYTHPTAIDILKLSAQRTLFFDYFNHNVRNYLIQSKKMAVALITNNVNTSKSASFFASYVSLQNFMDERNVSNISSIFNYKLKDQLKSKVAFLGLCYNSNISKCVSQPQRQMQVASSQKNIPKLLDFLNLQTSEFGEIEYVVAFRFNYPKFQSYVYHQALGILDQKFIFWISQLLEDKHKKIEQKQDCLWNSLIHRLAQNNLQDIETHAFLTKRIDEIKQRFAEELSLTKVVKIFHNDPKFTLCLTGSKPQSFDSNQEVSKVLQKIQTQFSSKNQQASVLQL